MSPPPHSEITILYQDQHLLVVDKPAKTLVVPAPNRPPKTPTITNLLQRQLDRRTYPVHRLDEDTTGVLVLAMTQDAKPRLEDLFRQHTPTRTYLALLSRAPQPPAGQIESRLREGKDGVMRSVLKGPGDTAITQYKVLRRTERYTLVECQLQTGRRNQIRVHMADLGCPIVGDRKYGFRVRQGRSFSRPLLHAESIAFIHPITGEPIHVQVDAREPELWR